MMSKTIAVLHPGNMGVTIGAAAATSGGRVVWVSEKRSQSTRERAARAGFGEIKNLAEAVRESDVILSVCPPHAALDVAVSVAKHKFNGIYIDANAISRTTAVEVGQIVTSGGASFVDGGIIGPPVSKPGTTRLYLSGPRAEEAAEIFSRSMLDARVIGEAAGAASALKVVYAAWTKCTDALLLSIRTLATVEGVDSALVAEWQLSQPELERRCARAAGVATPKAWRYVGEMEEIAATFATAGLPTGFHKAAAEICQRLTVFKDQTEPPLTVRAVVDRLRAPSNK